MWVKQHQGFSLNFLPDKRRELHFRLFTTEVKQLNLKIKRFVLDGVQATYHTYYFTIPADKLLKSNIADARSLVSQHVDVRRQNRRVDWCSSFAMNCKQTINCVKTSLRTHSVNTIQTGLGKLWWPVPTLKMFNHEIWWLYSKCNSKHFGECLVFNNFDVSIATGFLFWQLRNTNDVKCMNIHIDKSVKCMNIHIDISTADKRFKN